MLLTLLIGSNLLILQNTHFTMEYKITSEYKPTGDQPEAIAELVKGIESGNTHQTLLGLTVSGKTFTMANVIQ